MSEDEDDENYHVLFCNACRREVGLWNFYSLKGPEELPSHIDSKTTVVSIDGGRDYETMSCTEEQSAVLQDSALIQQQTSVKTCDSDMEKTESETKPSCAAEESVSASDETMEEDSTSVLEKCEGVESAMDTSEGDACGGQRCIETLNSTDKLLSTRPSSAEGIYDISISDDLASHDRKRIHSPLVLLESGEKSDECLEYADQMNQLEKLKCRNEREHPFMTPTHPSSSGIDICTMLKYGV